MIEKDKFEEKAPRLSKGVKERVGGRLEEWEKCLRGCWEILRCPNLFIANLDGSRVSKKGVWVLPPQLGARAL